MSKILNICRNKYLWVFIAAVINASEAIVVLMVATRSVGIKESGILSFSFTIANLMMTIGKFGVRNYQVTDAGEEYSWGDYYYARVITVFLMLFISSMYVFGIGSINSYELEKQITIFVVILLYAIEAYEDVFWGLFQKNDRIEVGAIIFSVRWFVTIVVLCLSLLIIKRTIISVSIAVTAEACVYIVLIHHFSYLYVCEEKKLNCSKVISLLHKCLPLFLSLFFSLYISNSAKYAIDKFLDEEVQACYGFVSMPIFVIGLINSIIYEPILVDMSIAWYGEKYRVFINYIKKQCFIIVLISAICMVGAFFLGVPILSLLYATDLTNYKIELMILMVGGIWLSFVGFFSAVLTILRQQKIMMYVYSLVGVLAYGTTKPVVAKWNSVGAAFISMILVFVICICFIIYSFLYINKKKC